MANLRGALYRKLSKEKKEKVAEGTRTRQMLNILRKKEGRKFRVYPATRLVTLPPRKDVRAHNIMYPLIRPYAYAHIKYDEEDNSLVYHVVEPRLSRFEEHVLEKIEEGLVQIIDVSLEDIKKQEKIMDFLETNIQDLIEQYGFDVSEKEYSKIMYYVFRNFVGLNEIEPLMNDPYIEDVGADGTGVPIYVVHQRFGSIKTNIAYKDTESMRQFVAKLAERADRYISYAEPLLDGTLPDGSRVQASLASDVTTRGPTFSIRKFREEPFSPVDMIRLGTTSPEMLAYLWFLVEHGSNMLIAGGVATGKTSLLNSISMFIPPEAKVVSIEDTREINIPHENWIPGVAREGFTGTGTGEVSMFELLRESFRQNPDYLVVGEIRGKEAYVMFQGMASGHPSMSTMHAGSVDDLMKRLQTRPISLSPGLLDSLDAVIVMIHARDKGKSARRIKEIVEIEGVDTDSGRARTTKSFVWIPADDDYEYRGDSWLLKKMSSERGIPMREILGEIAARRELLNWMLANNMTEMKDLAKYVNMYYNRREELEKIVGKPLSRRVRE